MYSKRDTCKLLEKRNNVSKWPIEAINVDSPWTEDVVVLRAPSFGRKQLCVGHPIKLPRLKIPEVVTQTSREPTSDSILERSKEEENKLRNILKNRVRFEPASRRYKKAQICRDVLPKISAREIRRFRYPWTVVLPQELEEDGYPTSASILEGFVHYNETMKKLAVKGSPFFHDPPLAKKPELLQKIADWLMVYEDASMDDPPDQAKQIDTLLEMAFHFLDHSETVAWITEKVLLLAIDLASAYPNDGYRKETLARFAYGCLLRNFSLYNHAVQELDRAYNRSLGKAWTFEGFSYTAKYQTVLVEVADVLCRVLLELAREFRRTRPVDCVRYCSRALRRLGGKQLFELEAEVLLELGMGYKEAEDFGMAENVFLEYLQRYHGPKFMHGISKAYLECAHCYSRLNEVEKAQIFLLKAVDSAESAGLFNQTAIAQRYVGESFMKMGHFKEASRCLVESFKIYLELGDHANLEHMRVLAAISLGMQVMPRVSDLLNASIGDERGVYLSHFLRWRTHRTPFWDAGASDAPEIPGEELFTSIPEQEQDVFWIGAVRVDLEDAKKAFTEYAQRRREADDRLLRLNKQEQEGASLSGTYMAETLPGYVGKIVNYRIPEFGIFTANEAEEPG